MDAVARLNLSNIKLLLSSGADVSRKTTIGWTAYSLALQEIKQFRENDARPPEYMPEMLKLLKPASSVL
jgi:ankyrin repeat protein